jgi:hypothetical protein
MRLRRPVSSGIVLPSVVAVLVLVNLAENGRLPDLGLANAVVAILLLSLMVWWAGGTRDDVGLGRGRCGAARGGRRLSSASWQRCT